jgi:tryptophanyl-tRNA synthetase
MKRVVSGIQPTKDLHIGNYLGSIKNWVGLQDQYQCMLFVANLHAMTIPYNPDELRNNTLNVTAAYLACGIDPKKSIIFAQSAIYEHTQLAWILNCITPTGWMNRMTQFKEKSEKYKENSSLGLYCYPVLMAADILLYKANFVPVGEDQKQHLELTRDIAAAFNRLVNKEFFTLPEPMIIGNGVRIMSLKDGTKKMSKSDDSDYTRINLTDSNEEIELKYRKAKTDSIAEIYYDKEKRPEISNLLNLYAALSGMKIKAIEEKYQSIGCATFKKDLAEITISVVSKIRSEHVQLMKNLDYVEQVLTDGQEKAQKIAADNMLTIQKMLGISHL